MEAARGSGMDSEVHDDPDEAKTALHSAPPKKRARTGSHREDGTEDAVATTIASSSRPVSPAGMLQEATEQTRAEWHDEEEEEGDGSTTKMYCTCQALFDEEKMMIACDRCDEWFHTACMKIAEDEVDLVDVFICPHCAKDTMQITTYKPKCLRVECKRAALRPLSRYCSERCGVLVAAMRIQRTKLAKGTSQKKLAEKLLHGPVASARRREGIVMWDADVGDQVKKTYAKSIMGQTRHAHLENALPSSEQDAQHDQSDVQGVTRQLEELARLQEEQMEVQRERDAVNLKLDTLAARAKLLQLADDRAAALEPVATGDDEPSGSGTSSKSKKSKSKKAATVTATSAEGATVETDPMAAQALKPRGQPRCGYDERLGWDEERFREWAARSTSRAMLDEAAPLDGQLDPYDPTSTATADAEHLTESRICGHAKRRCRRHADWSVVRGADFEVERDLQTRLLSRHAEQAQHIAARIAALRQDVQLTLSDTRQRRRNFDEAMARRLAVEGTRRAPIA